MLGSEENNGSGQSVWDIVYQRMCVKLRGASNHKAWLISPAYFNTFFSPSVYWNLLGSAVFSDIILCLKSFLIQNEKLRAAPVNL